jgi:peroxiredoxin
MGGDLDARHTRVIAISPDRTDELRAFRSKTRFKMTLLADSENQVIRQYNLQNRNFTPKRGPIRELVIPTTLLIDDLGIVRWIGQASDFRVQRSAQEIMQQIDAFLPGVACETCVLPGGAEIAAVR